MLAGLGERVMGEPTSGSTRSFTSTVTLVNDAIDALSARVLVLDPHGVAKRESSDSREHPQSLAIAVLFDVTGSMGHVPRVLQSKLPQLLGLLLRLLFWCCLWIEWNLIVLPFGWRRPCANAVVKKHRKHDRDAETERYFLC